MKDVLETCNLVVSAAWLRRAQIAGFENILHWCVLVLRKRPLNSRSRVGGRGLVQSATLSRNSHTTGRRAPAGKKIQKYKTSAACCAARLRLFFFSFVFSQGLGRLRSGLLGRSIRRSKAGRSDPGDQYEELRRDVLTREINTRNCGGTC